MGSDVNGTMQITKFVTPNSGEPFVVETKTTTTTTTTTVTKRICVPKDTNVDLTEIQTLLDDDKLTANSDVPPNVNVTIDTTKSDQNATTIDTAERTEQRINAKQNTTSNRSRRKDKSSLLSSTKIENLSNSLELTPKLPNKSRKSPRQQKPTPSLVRSPNLSKISIGTGKKRNIKSNSKRINNKSNANQSTPKQLKNKRITKTKVNGGKRKQMNTHSSQRMLRSTAGNQAPNYIDDLIHQYMSLENKPKRKKKSAPRVVKKQSTIMEPPPIDLPDLSAIFESSTEEAATATGVATMAAPSLDAPDSMASSISFNDTPTADNVDFEMGTRDDQLPVSSSTHLSAANEQISEMVTDTDVDVGAMPLKELTKSNRRKRNLPDTIDKEKMTPPSKVAVVTAVASSPTTIPSKHNNGRNKKAKKIVKKEPAPKTRATTKTTTKKPTQAIECDSTTSHDSIRSLVNYTPIKLYSPSIRAKFRSNADNKLILNKRIISRQLLNLPKKIRDRFDDDCPMVVDADSRLFYYPNGNNDGDDDGGGGSADNAHNNVSRRGDINDVENATPSSNVRRDILAILKQKKRPLLIKEIEI